MSLIGKVIRLKAYNGVSAIGIDIEVEGRDFLIHDKINATHHNNAGDDEYIVSSVLTGNIKTLLPIFLIDAKILPDGEQS